ncbi:hypothetical protein J132_02511 [Termitomyces sp. J132]|nr:hypothetical protein J132_02511 [Termitomyces sp. J132]
MLGIYATATIYGSWAVKQFLGPEMQALLVPDDPAAWRWTTFIALPGIPFALILDRFNFPTRYLTLFMISILPTRTAFGFILVLLARYVYRKAWTSLQIRILGYAPPSVCNINNTVVWDEWPVRIERQVDDDGVVRQGQGHGRNQTVLLHGSIPPCCVEPLKDPQANSRGRATGSGYFGTIAEDIGDDFEYKGFFDVVGACLVAKPYTPTWMQVKDMTELLHDAQVAVL